MRGLPAALPPARELGADLPLTSLRSSDASHARCIHNVVERRTTSCATNCPGFSGSSSQPGSRSAWFWLKFTNEAGEAVRGDPGEREFKMMAGRLPSHYAVINEVLQPRPPLNPRSRPAACSHYRYLGHMLSSRACHKYLLRVGLSDILSLLNTRLPHRVLTRGVELSICS